MSINFEDADLKSLETDDKNIITYVSSYIARVSIRNKSSLRCKQLLLTENVMQFEELCDETMMNSKNYEFLTQIDRGGYPSEFTILISSLIWFYTDIPQ